MRYLFRSISSLYPSGNVWTQSALENTQTIPTKVTDYAYTFLGPNLAQSLISVWL